MEIRYTLIRSSRRTLALEVTAEGEVVVRSPGNASLREIDAFVGKHRDWIARAMERQADRLRRHPLPTEAQQQEYRRKSAEWLPARVAYFAELMGVEPTGIRITGAKKRFGSCSSQNSLCFPLFLMGYPDAAIDYVIVHELAHIKHHDHSRAFWETVASYMPDYKQRQALLR